MVLKWLGVFWVVLGISTVPIGKVCIVAVVHDNINIFLILYMPDNVLFFEEKFCVEEGQF